MIETLSLIAISIVVLLAISMLFSSREVVKVASVQIHSDTQTTLLPEHTLLIAVPMNDAMTLEKLQELTKVVDASLNYFQAAGQSNLKAIQVEDASQNLSVFFDRLSNIEYSSQSELYFAQQWHCIDEQSHTNAIAAITSENTRSAEVPAMQIEPHEKDDVLSEYVKPQRANLSKDIVTGEDIENLFAESKTGDEEKAKMIEKTISDDLNAIAETIGSHDNAQADAVVTADDIASLFAAANAATA